MLKQFRELRENKRKKNIINNEHIVYISMKYQYNNNKHFFIII